MRTTATFGLHMLTRLQAKSKLAPPIAIFVDEQFREGSELKRCGSGKLSRAQSKKAKIEPPIKESPSEPSSDKSENTTTPQEKCDVNESKKIMMSTEEKQMNGAPEGDLFDVVVLEETQLSKFLSDELASQAVQNAFENFRENLVWAEKYLMVENLRRIAKFHESLITMNEIIPLTRIFHDAIASLRSSNVKNGILGLKEFNSKFGKWQCREIVISNFSIFLNKTANSPKFICDLAQEAAVDYCNFAPPLTSISGLAPFACHKNATVASLAVALVSKCCETIDYAELSASGQLELLKESVGALSTGLGCRRTEGKEKAKAAFTHLKTCLGGEPFAQLIAGMLPPPKVSEVQRLWATQPLTAINTNTLPAAADGSMLKSHSEKALPGAAAKLSMKDRILQMKAAAQDCKVKCVIAATDAKENLFIDNSFGAGASKGIATTSTALVRRNQAQIIDI